MSRFIKFDESSHFGHGRLRRRRTVRPKFSWRLRTRDDPQERRRAKKIPSHDTTLDLAELGEGRELRIKVLSLIHNLFPHWSDVKDESRIQLETISGALTNRVFFVTALPDPTDIDDTRQSTNLRRVLMRVYGSGVDQLFERTKELEYLHMLSRVNIGPSLLGTFNNGRFEQYLDSTALTRDDLRNPKTSAHIAARMATLHHIVEIFPPPQDTVPEVWVNIDKWYHLAVKLVCTEDFQRDSSKAERIQNFDLHKLQVEIDELKRHLATFNSPIVFAHNDTQYGNILRLNDGSDELVVIDFEYAGYNYRGFDIANHFCEWLFNYHSSEPHLCHLEWYPNISEQKNFLRSYVEMERTLQHQAAPESFDQILEPLLLECTAFCLASHVMWGLWGLVQASHSQIHFDYFGYGIQRLEEFRRLKHREIDKC